MRKKPKHVIRTKTPGYFFGAQKAADSQQRRRGTTRTPSKLPTSLAELTKAFDDHVYSSGFGTGASGALQRAFGPATKGSS